jgi:hypothetical protein
VQASDAERRGQALFAKAFPNDPGLSCAGCHIRSAAFVDHLQHDVGSGGFFKTPTLLNANFNAPYFHDGRYDNYAAVVTYFDRLYGLGLTSEEQMDLVAYLHAVGDGQQPYERDGVIPRIAEIMDFASVLGMAIPARDGAIIALVADTVGGELRELTEKFPAPKDTTVAGGREQRSAARAALKDVVLCLRRLSLAADGGHFEEVTGEYVAFRQLIAAAAVPLQNAEPWSLFDQGVHDAHYGALRQMNELAAEGSH